MTKTIARAATGRSERDDPNARPGIRERYAAATSSGCNGLDVIAAAGMARNDLGIALLRLTAEFDSIRADLRRSSGADAKRAAAAKTLSDEGRRCERQAQDLEDLHGLDSIKSDVIRLLRRRAEKCRAHAEDALRASAAEILTERFEVLSRMTTLRAAQRQIAARAHTLNAKRMAKAFGGSVVLALSGRVLDVYLDETCEACNGSAVFTTGYDAGKRSEPCRKCAGTGHRRNIIGEGQAQRGFAATLLADLQQAAGAAAKALRAAMRIE
jgi:hypothetical protein